MGREGRAVIRLSPSDSTLLALETDVWPQHVGGLITLGTTDAPDFGFDKVRELFSRRIGRVPKMTWKLKDVPLRLGRPLWTEGGRLDIDQHLQRIAVPPPGGPREVGALMGELMRGRLEHGMPMWRMWYLDGLPEGTAAIFSKYHHALMDGASSTSLSDIVLDLEPNPPPDPERDGGGEDLGGRYVSYNVLASGLSLLAGPVKVARYAASLSRRAAQLAPLVLRQGLPSALLDGAPPTSLNRPVGPRRMVAFASVSLDDVKAARRRLGATVNDVIVAICAAALERYLGEAGEGVPDRPLSIMVPVSTREPGDMELTNRLSAIPISVPTTVDPIERVRAVSGDVKRGRRLTDIFKESPLPPLGEFVPPFVFGGIARATIALTRWMPVMANASITSVRGAPIPLYVAGARVTGTYPASVIMLNYAVNFTALSSADQVDVGIMVDPDQVADPWLLADGVATALEELMRAVGVGDPHPVPLLSAAGSVASGARAGSPRRPRQRG